MNKDKKILIIGLGNPGIKYEKTWHNVGFKTVTMFAKENQFPIFSSSNKQIFETSESDFNNKRLILMKPLTFMNNSGKAVKTAINKYKQLTDIIIVHDDIDIPLGKIKIVKDRGSAGHNGINSIINEIKTKNFTRIRIGVNPVGNKLKNAEKFVLRVPTEEQSRTLKQEMEKATVALTTIIDNGIEVAMNKFNN